MNCSLMQQLLTTLQAGRRREEGGTDGWRIRWMDGWMDGQMHDLYTVDVCFPVTVALQENCQSYFLPLSHSHASLRRPPYLTLRPFDTLFISISLSLHLAPFMSPSFSPPDSLPLSLPLSDLLFTSLSDSFSLSLP